jgi:hypothetical protein
MSQGQGSLSYQAANASTSAGVLTSANNGLSLDATGKIAQLGAPAGAAAAAVLLNNREIPFAGFGLLLSGIGNTVTGNLVMQSDAARVFNTSPFMLFLDSAAREIGRINFQSPLPTLFGMTAIGRSAGALNTGANNNGTYIGFNAGSQDTGNNNTVVGGKAYELANGAGSQNTAIGANAMANNALAIGNNNTAVGYQAGYVLGTGAQNNTLLGRDAGGGIYFGSADNVFIGFQTGLFFTSSGAATSQNVVIGSATMRLAVPQIGNNNVVIGYGCINSNTQSLQSNNTLIGALITSTVTTVTNSSVFGQGINIDVSNVCVIGRADQNVVVGASNVGTDDGAKLQLKGSMSVNLRETAVGVTLNNLDFVTICTAGGLAIVLPGAAIANHRMLCVVNQGAVGTISSYTDFTGSASTVLPANGALWLISNGALWRRIGS